MPYTKTCFVIGRMGDGYMARLEKLAREIIAPLVERAGYQVVTPDKPSTSGIMDDVLDMLDRAELVVADVTGHNPNVLYELGIRHSLGKPTIVVTETDVPFDIRAYRYHPINIDDPADTIAILHPVIAEITGPDVPPFADNPVTKFYSRPMTHISPAIGLAVGYYVNFLRPAVQRLTALSDEGHAYRQSITIRASAAPDAPVLHTFGTEIDGRRGLKMLVLIPPEVKYMNRTTLTHLKAQALNYYVIDSQPRPFTGYARQAPDTGFLLCDFPTPLNAIDDAITNRLGRSQVGSPAWLELEQREMRQFRDELERWRRGEPPDIRDRIEIVHYDRRAPVPPYLAWLTDHWG